MQEVWKNQGPGLGRQLARKLGHQSYNHEELNPAIPGMGLEASPSPGTKDGNKAILSL